MVVIMNPDAREENIMAVVKAIESVGLTAKIMEGAQQKIVGVIGDKTRMGSLAVEAMEGVEQTVAISKSYKLASREFHPANTVVDVIKSNAKSNLLFINFIFIVFDCVIRNLFF